ncbi:MAG: 2-polyprenylphenol 6-hydroxylase [Janthinobacterium lividum]
MIINLLRMLSVISKQRLLTHCDEFDLPIRVKIIGRFLELLLCPLVLFQRPLNDFGKRMSNCLEQLGPIYIKLGQTLSTRPDLVGAKIATSLKYLQDALPQFSSDIAKTIIKKEFDKEIKEIFTYFSEEVIASASIAQVHQAQLLSGELVAVKILRPGIRKKYMDDINLLFLFAKIGLKISKTMNRLRPLEVIEVFVNTMNQELDLRTEAAAMSEVADNSAMDLNICIPKIYWQFNSSNILVTQWIDGISIYDTEGLLKRNIDRVELSKNIAVMFFNQAYEYGLFHADLHPGNILVKDTGKIALLDFGIMGRLADTDRLAIAEILAAFLRRDYLRVAQVHIKNGYVPKITNPYSFASSCRTIYEPMIGVASKDISIGKLLMRLFEITKQFGMETQPQLLLLQKTMVIIEGIGQSLNPDLNMWELAKPWITKWAIKNLSPEAKILRTLKAMINQLLDKY